MCIHDECLPVGPVTIETGRESRLLVCERKNAEGRRLVTIAPQYQDQATAWRLSHSGLMLLPHAARELASALETLAAAIEETSPR
jgi:hypothetical protein